MEKHTLAGVLIYTVIPRLPRQPLLEFVDCDKVTTFL